MKNSAYKVYAIKKKKKNIKTYKNEIIVPTPNAGINKKLLWTYLLGIYS